METSYNVGDRFILPLFNFQTREWIDIIVTIIKKVLVPNFPIIKEGEYYILDDGRKVVQGNLYD